MRVIPLSGTNWQQPLDCQDCEELMNKRKLIRIMSSESKNIKFSDAIELAKTAGFHIDRTSGSHHILVHPEIREMVNLQNVRGEVKPYQFRQLLRLIECYNLLQKDESDV